MPNRFVDEFSVYLCSGGLRIFIMNVLKGLQSAEIILMFVVAMVVVIYSNHKVVFKLLRINSQQIGAELIV
jgi:hypothetical protein